jgi:SAM-dependent methyltransferase
MAGRKELSGRGPRLGPWTGGPGATSCAGLANVSVLHGDFLTAELDPGAFEVVTALASMHHLPFNAAIQRSREVLRPGGTLVVLGIWTDNISAADRVLNRGAGVMNRLYQRIWGPDVMNSPATMPTMTLPDVRRAAAALVPRATVRRHLLWRYVLVWHKPPD